MLLRSMRGFLVYLQLYDIELQIYNIFSLDNASCVTSKALDHAYWLFAIIGWACQLTNSSSAMSVSLNQGGYPGQQQQQYPQQNFAPFGSGQITTTVRSILCHVFKDPFSYYLTAG